MWKWTLAASGVVMTLSAGSAPSAESERPLRTAPLIRGTLWWIVYEDHGDWTKEQFAEAIEAQHAVGFDVLWILNAPALLQEALKAEAGGKPHDIMDMVYSIADEKHMRVIADLPKGGWYGKTTATEMAREMEEFAVKFHARYGAHESFWAWYLNHEINPIVPGGVAESAYWRQAWKGTVEACHRIAPGTVVTISPFFLLDEARVRGFVYLTPEQYATWWGATLEETGIDILMLQDSGEHLSFFTLEQREPFFAAVAESCHKVGAQFWVNVETGEANVADWDEYLKLSSEGKVPWRFTPIDWLERKLCLAARYGDAIINWGYFPYMEPTKQRPTYDAYKAYYERTKSAGAKPPPSGR